MRMLLKGSCPVVDSPEAVNPKQAAHTQRRASAAATAPNKAATVTVTRVDPDVRPTAVVGLQSSVLHVSQAYPLPVVPYMLP
mmetsp:Transcript_36309/g.66518  ORF Transcript_36309/g.66518 Transcript_36309/m.66518 type:complete len:82 (-) Transcript_36309:375-620(-)